MTAAYPDAARTYACDSVRTSMARLPGPLQTPLTWATGRPLPWQRQVRLTAGEHLAAALSSLAVGVVLDVAATVAAGWWLLLLGFGWALTLHGLRNLRMMVFHQCAHLTTLTEVPRLCSPKFPTREQC